MSSCKRGSHSRKSEKVWTIGELKSLRGKTRDEVKELLGVPTGMLTYNSKGRWQYINVPVETDKPGRSNNAMVTIYFSQSGEERVTIVEIL